MRSYPVDLVIAGRNGRHRQRLRGLELDSMRETRWLLLLHLPVVPDHHCRCFLRRIRLERASLSEEGTQR